MRKIVNSTYVTLDGVIQNPQDWPSLGGFGEVGTAVQTELLARCDAVLMGRHTYESFAPVWSARSGDPLSDRMNALPKYVGLDDAHRPAVAQHGGLRPRSAGCDPGTERTIGR